MIFLLVHFCTLCNGSALPWYVKLHMNSKTQIANPWSAHIFFRHLSTYTDQLVVSPTHWKILYLEEEEVERSSGVASHLLSLFDQATIKSRCNNLHGGVETCSYFPFDVSTHLQCQLSWWLGRKYVHSLRQPLGVRREACLADKQLHQYAS